MGVAGAVEMQYRIRRRRPASRSADSQTRLAQPRTLLASLRAPSGSGASALPSSIT